MKDKNENSPLKIVFVGDYFRKEKGFDFLIDSLKDVQFPVKLYVISKYTNKYDSFSNKNLKIEFIDKLEQKKYAEFLGDKDIIISSSLLPQNHPDLRDIFQYFFIPWFIGIIIFVNQLQYPW